MPAPDETKMSWPAVCARRLQRHGLLEPLRDTRPAEVAGAMCGVHAQIFSAAELSLGLRIADLTRAEVRRSLWEEGSLVKTYGPRGTVHLLPTEDLPIWTGALSALPPSPSGYPEGVRLSPEEVEALVETMAEVLANAALTADELTEVLGDRLGAWAVEPIAGGFRSMWPRWRLEIVTAANKGALCFGPNRGSKVTYTNPRRWLPDFAPADERTALAEVVKRYLYAYGPATPAQFARWFAAPRGWANELFDLLAAELEHVTLDDEPAWVVSGDTAMPSIEPRGLRLLPYFDAYAVGSHPRDKVFPGQASERALAGGQAGNFPVLLIDGVVAGVWHQRRAGKKIEITVEPLRELSAAQRRALDAQVERVGEFLEGTPRLTIGKVTVGAHA